jgi:programmed cell death protein 5
MAAIRAKRMAQMSGGAGMPGGMPGGMGGMGGNMMMDMEKQKQQADQAAAADEQRAQILKAILSPEARERMSNIKMVKPDKARKIEDMLIMRSQRGQLGGVVDEETLIQMLESINEQTEAKSKVSFTRRRMDDDWD